MIETEELPSCPTTNNRSAIKATLEAIEAEHIAAERGLHDYSQVTKHQFITARMENMGLQTEQLVELVGDREKAMKMVIDRLNQSEQGEARHAS